MTNSDACGEGSMDKMSSVRGNREPGSLFSTSLDEASAFLFKALLSDRRLAMPLSQYIAVWKVRATRKCSYWTVVQSYGDRSVDVHFRAEFDMHWAKAARMDRTR